VTPVPASAHVPVRNRILSKLANAEYRRLRPSLEQVALHENQVLYGPGDAVSHIYFPNDAVTSLLFNVDERRTVEVAMEGNEGAVGLAIHLGGVNSCNLSVVRNAGTAMRMDVNALTKCANQRGDLQGVQPVARAPLSYFFRKFIIRCIAWIQTRGFPFDSKSREFVPYAA
jgi:hypothetical protein